MREIQVQDSQGEGGGQAILNEFRIKMFSELLMSSLIHLSPQMSLLQDLKIS